MITNGLKRCLVAAALCVVTIGLIERETVAQVFDGRFTNLIVRNEAQFGRARANYIRVRGAATTVAPSLTAVGTDTNVSVSIVPKGTGRLSVTGGLTATGTLIAGSGPTTLTDATGKLLSAALNTISVGQGGTGATTLTANGVLYGNGTSAVQITSQGAANTVLTANAGVPSFSTNPTVTSLTADSVVGNTSVASRFVHSADALQTLDTAAALVVTAGKSLFPVDGLAGAVTACTVPNGTTVGEVITILGAHGTNTVQFGVNDATNIASDNGVTTRTLATSDVLVLMWSGTAWVELAFKNNL